MSAFSIDTFASEIKATMAEASPDDPALRQAAATKYFRAVLAKYPVEEIMSVLQASIPEGANIGEMIIHTSPELTMLFGGIPPHFQSAIHNHTIFACIASLIGTEENIIYKLNNGIDEPPSIEREFKVEAGEVIELAPDCVHSICNPTDSVLYSLHIYGGDFGAVMGERTLWTSDELKAMQFSFPALMKESAKRMKLEGNEQGLQAMAEAIPALKGLVDSLNKGDDNES